MDTVRDWGRALRRWGGLVLLGALVGGGAAYASSFRHPTVYMAEATVQVISGVTGNESAPVAVTFAANLQQTYARTIRSSPVLSEVRRLLHLRGTLRDVDEQLVIRALPGSNLLTITAYGDTPTQAADVANTTATVFIRQTAAQRAAAQATQRADLEARRAANEATLRHALLRQAVAQALPERLAAPVIPDRAGLEAAITRATLTRADLSRRLDILRTQQALDIAPARLVDPALPPSGPVAVRGGPSLSVAALVGGVVAAVALAVLARAAVPPLPARPRRLSGLGPVLGAIPRRPRR